MDYVKNYAQIESVLNHIHLLDFFVSDEKKDEINYEQIFFLGKKLCEIYSAKLKNDFPEKEFIFNFNGDEKLEAFDDYEISFYQRINLERKTK